MALVQIHYCESAEITRYASDGLYLFIHVLEHSSCRMQRDSTHALMDPWPIR
jgi:hypothetical protein